MQLDDYLIYCSFFNTKFNLDFLFRYDQLFTRTQCAEVPVTVHCANGKKSVSEVLNVVYCAKLCEMMR